MPLSIVVKIIVLWVAIEFPLTYLGVCVGTWQSAIRIPCQPMKLCTDIPPQPWYLHPVFTAAAGGFIPFVYFYTHPSTTFVELIYIFISIWGEYFYCVFGFLMAIMIVLVIVSAEIAVVQCYLQLVNGDHRWWWRSFWTPAFSGAYVGAYGLFHYFSAMKDATATSSLVYFGHVVAFAGLVSLVTGTVGLVATFFFVKLIYSLIKAD